MPYRAVLARTIDTDVAVIPAGVRHYLVGIPPLVWAKTTYFTQLLQSVQTLREINRKPC